MNYCKITTTGQTQMMPNPFRLTIANPTEAQKATLAALDNWLEMVYTDQPTYDPETQYLTESWSEVDGKAVQAWTVHDLPPAEATEEDYENSLEDLGMNTDEESDT